MTGKELNDALSSGKRVYGTLLVAPSPVWANVVGTLGLDFVFIDTEHIPLDRSMLSWMCQLYYAIGLAPVVRIQSPDPYEASMVLDAGAKGVIAPYVETVSQVRQLVGAVKKKPLKGAILEKLLNNEDPVPGLQEHLVKRTSDNVLIVNIESVPAMESLDGILETEGLDGILIGPNDLSYSLGIPEQYHHPKFKEAVDYIFSKARGHHKSAGIHMIYPDGISDELEWARKGANIMIHGADILAFQEKMAEDIRYLRSRLNDDWHKGCGSQNHESER